VGQALRAAIGPATYRRSRLSTLLPPLSGFELIACEGADTEAFLQAQLSNDVRELAAVNTQWTALLSPQGRVQALMLLVRVTADRYLLAVPHGRATAVIDYLRRYLLRRKSSLRLETGLALSRVDRDTPADMPPTGSWPLRLDLDPGDGASFFIVEQEPSAALSGDATQWRLRDLRAGIPWLPEAACDRHLPHALRLDQLPAISLKKGCYPGQEIVARTHYLGRNKRVLVLLCGEARASEGIGAGSVVRDAKDQLAGELVDAIATDQETFALAVLTEERIDGPLRTATADGATISWSVARRFPNARADAKPGPAG